MQATKFQVKLYTRAGDIELEKLIPVFHEWIRTKKISDELLIDVADYAHVPQGPGVVLIGHQSDYYLDVADNRPGLLYSRKRGFEGDFQAGIDDAFRRALNACQLLEVRDQRSALPRAGSPGRSERGRDVRRLQASARAGGKRVFRRHPLPRADRHGA
ncbi:MAG: hypothetical protein JRG67_16300 [Deltaproteobacteria bacterium]|nr:hypothetical protein [Deltaproteobacteria bacterium]